MISIIIPTLNEESVLENTLKSLKEKLTLPHEIIITDGHSTDKTVEIAHKYADKVVVFNGNYRQTIPEGRNDGAKVAVGDFFIYIDADCHILDPNNFFSQALAFFETHPKYVAMTVSIRVLPQYETWADKIVFISLNTYFWFLNSVFGFGISAGEFQMIRSDVFKSINGYNPKLIASEDVDLFNRLSKIGKIKFNHDLTIYHTGRRAHKIGWPKLLYLWMRNTMTMFVSGKAHSKEWTVIR
jgi:glycosyltransferase involved in cell wall biosynthesis